MNDLKETKNASIIGTGSEDINMATSNWEFCTSNTVFYGAKNEKMKNWMKRCNMLLLIVNE